MFKVLAPLRLCGLIIFLFYSAQTVAQNFSPVFTETKPGSALGAGFDYGFNSSSVSVKFFNTFYRGNFIDADLKESVFKHMKDKNRLGFDLNYGLWYVHNPDSNSGKTMSWFVSLRNRQHADALFAGNLFKNYFAGNKQFAGQTVSLAETRFNYLNYRQLQFGMSFLSDKGDSKVRFGAGLSLLKGEQNLNLFLSKADLFTAADGQYIDLDMALEVRNSDISNKNFFDMKGYGAALDLFLGIERQKSIIRFELSDFGFIAWNRNAQSTHNDTAIHFEGLSIDNLFQIGDSLVNSLNADSIKTDMGFITEDISYSTPLPSMIHLGYTHKTKDNLRINAGFAYRMAANYSPYIYIGTEHIFKGEFNINTRFAWGGYGTYNISLGMSKQFGKGFKVNLGTNNLEGLLITKAANGVGAYINLIGYF
jgi:hypothetical protein